MVGVHDAAGLVHDGQAGDAVRVQGVQDVAHLGVARRGDEVAVGSDAQLLQGLAEELRVLDGRLVQQVHDVQIAKNGHQAACVRIQHGHVVVAGSEE